MIHPRLLFLSVLLSSRVRSAQAAPEDADCTARSLQLPSFLVRGFNVSRDEDADSDSVSFQVINRADDFSSNCYHLTDPAADEWYDCEMEEDLVTGPIQARVHLEARKVELHHLWICADMTNPVTFEANAEFDMPETNNNNTDLLVRATLIAPISITPTFFESSSSTPSSYVDTYFIRGHDTPGCRERSKHPQWRVEGFAPHNLAASLGRNPVLGTPVCTQWNLIPLTLVNLANGVATSCTEYYMGGACSFRAPDTGFWVDARDIEVHFDPLEMKLNITSSWYCDDEDPAEPVQIHATGVINLKNELTCTGEWPPTEIGNSGCLEADRTCETWEGVVAGEVTSVTPVRPFSLREPEVDATACSVDSFGNPRLYLEQFTIWRDPAPGRDNTTLWLSFRAPSIGERSWFNLTADYDTLLTRGSETWYDCYNGEPGLESRVWRVPDADCHFKFDWAQKNQLTLRESWICDDLDNETQILFNITTTHAVPFQRTITREEEEGDQDSGTPTLEVKWDILPRWPSDPEVEVNIFRPSRGDEFRASVVPVPYPVFADQAYPSPFAWEPPS
ncbi:hypothetical protein F4778DRAFT_749167 [Xylariomycetidae sp. FL2044]|nr:hypothetical protein F4778DRAFT_749167 [Xylariomycetidae sp. FL2044]